MPLSTRPPWQAEDYDPGGEGVAFHDTTSGNAGGVYRQGDGDLEVPDTDNSPNIGRVQAGELLAYTVNVTTAGAPPRRLVRRRR